MIYLYPTKRKTLSYWDFPDFQSYYEACLDDCNLKAVRCTCSKDQHMNRNGFYTREVIAEGCKETVRIQRMRCPHCGRSDALFPVDIIPYSSILMDTMVLIITTYLNTPEEKTTFKRTVAAAGLLSRSVYWDESADTGYLYRLVKLFELLWRQEVSRFRKYLSDISRLSLYCFISKGRQFMQNRGSARLLHTGRFVTGISMV